jgi:ankyrin repeat protein
MLPLFSAARSGNAAIVKLLLEESDKDPRRPAKYGQTPLHCAASASKVSAAIIKLHLKTKDVDPDAKDMGEVTPLSIAAKLGNL